MPEVVTATTLDLIERARQRVRDERRWMLGIVGSPGAGKSTVAEAIAAALSSAAVLVPMDGFHLANSELERLHRRDRKGAPDTFDAAGYAALLRRIREQEPGDATVYAPCFRRDVEESIGSAIAVDSTVPLVITEGNYLLLDSGPWKQLQGLLDEVWFLVTPDNLRLARLVERHEAFGKEPASARAWAHGPDQRNAEVIEATRDRADLVVYLES